MRSSATPTTEGSLKNIVIDEYRPYTYALTISPTEDPTIKSVIDCNVKLSDLISSSYDGVSFSISHEIKNSTNVVHLHCWIITKKPISYKVVNRLNPGWQFFFREITTRDDLIKWNAYCLKNQNEFNSQRLIEHDLNVGYAFH